MESVKKKCLHKEFVAGSINKCPHTVPGKCKLTVSTRNSILDPRCFRESRIEFRGSSFEFRESRIEFRVSRHSKNFSRLSKRDFEETIYFSHTEQ